jgi:hypothetical protein
VLSVLLLRRILLVVSSLVLVKFLSLVASFLAQAFVTTTGLLGLDLVVLILAVVSFLNLIGFLLDVIVVLTGSLVFPAGKANCVFDNSFLALVLAIVNLSAFIIGDFVCFPNHFIIAHLTVGEPNVLFHTNQAKFVGSQPDNIIQSVKLISLLVPFLPIDCCKLSV